MSDPSKHAPYITLGKHLRYLREQQRQSLAEVSGAVEIDEHALEKIEAGHERPAEEILLLLISYFNMQDQEAVQLWELAGYDGSDNSPTRPDEALQEALSSNKPVVVVVGMDSRTTYTDSVEVVANGSGVTIHFGQLNSKKQQQTIAKLGMSHEQAQEVIKQLQLALLKSELASGPKLLPPNIPNPSDQQ